LLTPAFAWVCFAHVSDLSAFFFAACWSLTVADVKKRRIMNVQLFAHCTSKSLVDEESKDSDSDVSDSSVVKPFVFGVDEEELPTSTQGFVDFASQKHNHNMRWPSLIRCTLSKDWWPIPPLCEA
jgi:hypothetical protein